MLRTIIVDDEELSIKRLQRLLSESGMIEICHAFQHPQEAYEYVQSNPIDAAFLDISMPLINGLRLSSLLSSLDEQISIVFVTGYEEYALKAFDLSAVDYVLKPVDEERLQRTLVKLRKYRRMADNTPTVPDQDMAVLLFNGFKLYSGGSNRMPIKLRSPKTEELFAFLICKGNVTREEVIETMWPGLSGEKALHNLNTNLYYIRKTFGRRRADSVIEANRNEIMVNESGIYCDLYRFNRIWKQLRSADSSDEMLIKELNDLYAGPLLEGRAYPWADELIRSIEQDYIGFLELAGRRRLREARLSEALAFFTRLLLLDALREDIHYEVISLYIRMDRSADAIRQYRTLESSLLTELGIPPANRVRELMQAVIE